MLAELRSLPQPDIAIRTRAELLGEADDPPLLIVEVANSSLRFDRITKSRLYARHGIADYSIVNVEDEAVEVHRDPTGDGWGSRTVHRAGEVLRPLLLGEVALELGPLLDFTAARTS